MVVTASSGMQKSDEREEEGMKGILEKRGRKSARMRSLPSADLPSTDLFSALLTLLNHFFFSDSLLASFQNPYKKRTALYFYAFQCN